MAVDCRTESVSLSHPAESPAGSASVNLYRPTRLWLARGPSLIALDSRTWIPTDLKRSKPGIATW